MEREEKGNQDVGTGIKGALRIFIKEVEEEVFSQLADLDKQLEEPVAREIRDKIKQRALTELQKDADALLERFKRSVTRDIINRVLRDEKLRKKKELEEEQFPRFNLQFRIQHMMLFTSVIILILTGLPLKFPNVSVLADIVYVLGGIESSRILHRVGAALLILMMTYHTFYSIFHWEGRRDILLLMPRPKDIMDFFKNIQYFLGFSKDRPRFGRFSYIEKFDYWALYWGCVIMIGTGAMLWFQDMALRFFPKFILDISKEAHSDEAMLATLAIVIWHFYNVHLNPDKFPMSWTWWTGTISKSEMEEEHPLEYEEILKRREETKGQNKTV